MVKLVSIARLSLLLSIVTMSSFSLKSIKVKGVVPIVDYFSKCSYVGDFPETDKCYKFKVEWQCRIVIKEFTASTKPSKDINFLKNRFREMEPIFNNLKMFLNKVRERPTMLSRISDICKGHMDDVQKIYIRNLYSGEGGSPSEKLTFEKNIADLMEMVKKVKHCFLNLKLSHK